MICIITALLTLFIVSYGQQNVCEGLRGLNTTRLRQRVNNSDGSIIAYSEISLFLQNGSLIEISLQNKSDERIGRYRIREERNEETVCILEREIEGETRNYTDCETLTITAKSNSVEGAEGCSVDGITNSSQCLPSCRTKDGVTDPNLVAYIIEGKIKNDKLYQKGRGLTIKKPRN